MLHHRILVGSYFQLLFFCVEDVSSNTLRIVQNKMLLIPLLLSAVPMQKYLLQILILDNFRYSVGQTDMKIRQFLSILPFAIKYTNKMHIFVEKIMETN